MTKFTPEFIEKQRALVAEHVWMDFVGKFEIGLSEALDEIEILQATIAGNRVVLDAYRAELARGRKYVTALVEKNDRR